MNNDSEKTSNIDLIIELSKQRDNIKSYLQSHIDTLIYFIRKNDPKEENLTALGFSLFYMASLSERENISYSQFKEIIDEFYPKLLEKSEKVHKGEKTTETDKLPNSYNTSIQLAGIFKACQYLKGSSTEAYGRINKIKKIESHLKRIANQLKKTGFISRLDSSETPSPYLTYWSLECLLLSNIEEETKKKILKKTKDWSLNSLYKLITYSFANIEYAVDSIEMCYLILILQRLLKAKRDESSNSLEIKNIIDHAVSLLFTKYFNLGCFTKSLPVFATKKGFSLICSTVEPLALLLVQADDWLNEHLKHLCQVFDFLKGSEISIKDDASDAEIKSWRSEWEHSSSKPTLFLTISAVVFLDALISSISRRMSDISCNEFTIKQIIKSEDNNIEERFNRYFTYDKIKERIEKICDTITKREPHTIIIRCHSSIIRDAFVDYLALKNRKYTELGIVHLDLGTLLAKGLNNLEIKVEKLFMYLLYIDRVLIYIDNIDLLNRDTEHKDPILQFFISSIYFHIKKLCQQSNCLIVIGEKIKTETSTKLVKERYAHSVETIAPLGKANAKSELKRICQTKNMNNEILEAIIKDEETRISEILESYFIPDIEFIANKLVELIEIHKLEEITERDEEICETVFQELMEYTNE